MRNCKAIIIALLCIIILSLIFNRISYTFSDMNLNGEVEAVLDEFFKQRNCALIFSDPQSLKDQFDLSSKYGKWSFENQQKRIKYIKDWSRARGVTFTGCETKLKIFSIKGGQDAVKIYLNEITKLVYKYDSIKTPFANEFCYGTYHTIRMYKKQDKWYVTVDWYNDPFDDSMPENAQPAVSIQESIPKTTMAFAYNRIKAVEYADKYCGANYYLADGYKYNRKYRNYANQGGDCANFASQVLSDSSAGSIRMSSGWLYNFRKGEASAAWINAGAFTHNMLYSGRAKLAAKGKYNRVVNYEKAISPGDIICYEIKGDIVHVSIVTALDSAGVPLVDSHTNNRYHVPWDLGWNSDNVTFWFLKVNG